MKLLTFSAAALMPCALAGQDSSVIMNFQNSALPFDLVITEIMADPDPSFGLPVAEYVEILNRSENPVDLTGWTLFDGSMRVLPGMELQPQQHLIICANADTSNFVQLGNVAGVSSLSLTNGGEKIAIRNPSGLSIDSVTYSDTWHENSYKKDGGWSLERIDPNFTCEIPENWQSSISNSGGTPGTINSINGIFTDNTAPVLLRAYCPDSASVIVIFSEALDPFTANLVQNYVVTNSPDINSAEMADASNSKVMLHLSQSLHTGQIGFIQVNGVYDCAGNKIAGNNIIRFGLADTSNFPKIVINEILFNPFEEGYDFIELYNAGNGITDLSKLQIASVNLTTGEFENVAFISEEQWMIFPGDYFVLSAKPDHVASHYRSSYPMNFVEVADMPSMNTDAGHVALLSSGVTVDEVRYDEDFHFPLLENLKGVSLEKINPLRYGMDPNAWHSASSSSGYASPGLKNSQFTENTLEAKNVSVQPEIFSPDQDGKDDVITFNLSVGIPGYISKIRIYNSGGHVIFEDAGNVLLGTKDTFSWDGITNAGDAATPGIYVALIEIFHLEGEVKHYKLPFVVAVKL